MKGKNIYRKNDIIYTRDGYIHGGGWKERDDGKR